MRIDIKTGGLDRFVSGMNSFLTDRDASSSGINSALQTISDRTGNLKGGVGALSEALGFISGRRLLEERRETAIRKVKEQTDNFTTTVIRADNQVAAMIKASNELFYQEHEWLRPPPPPTLRERWVDGRNRFWGSVGETISNAWNGVVEWYQNTPWVQHVVTAIAFAALVALTIVTKGAAAKLLFKFAKKKAIKMTVKVTSKAATGAVTQLTTDVATGVMNGQTLFTGQMEFSSWQTYLGAGVGSGLSAPIKNPFGSSAVSGLASSITTEAFTRDPDRSTKDRVFSVISSTAQSTAVGGTLGLINVSTADLTAANSLEEFMGVARGDMWKPLLYGVLYSDDFPNPFKLLTDGLKNMLPGAYNKEELQYA